jgi:hypothetical protein
MGTQRHMKTRLYVDLSNLYHGAKNKYRGKINFKAYRDFLEDIFKIETATAYGVAIGDYANSFIGCLQALGYATKYREFKVRRSVDWTPGIVVDIMLDVLENGVKSVIVGSSNEELKPLYEFLRLRGVSVVVFAVNVPKTLTESVDKIIEVPKSLLENSDGNAPRTL